MVGVDCRGLHDWVVQRVSALIIGLYVIFLFGFICLNYPLDYATWHQLFSNVAMKIATMIVMLSIVWHAWIGLWTVFTDYVKPRCVRLVLEVFVVVALIGYVVWCIDALWG